MCFWPFKLLLVHELNSACQMITKCQLDYCSLEWIGKRPEIAINGFHKAGILDAIDLWPPIGN